MSLSLVPAAASRTIDFMGVSRLLGIERRSDAYRVRYLEALIAHEHFPAALPWLRGKDLHGEVHPRWSRWLRDPVEAWLYGTVPPNLVPAIDDAKARAAAARMDRNAEGMVA